MSQSNQVEIFGILNITPNSFSDGGEFFTLEAALDHAEQLFNDGADYIDVGAEATNPNAAPISAEEEWRRLELILPALTRRYAGRISLDSYHPAVARKGLEQGVAFINDVTMFRDPAMMQLAVDYSDQARFVVGHLSPDVASVAEAHKKLPTSTVSQVKRELLTKRQQMIDLGVPASKIILDSDIGFGKSLDNNYALHWKLLKFAAEVPGIDVMTSYSRKRFLGPNRQDPEVNLMAAKLAVLAGSKYLRVHNVAAHRQLLNEL